MKVKDEPENVFVKMKGNKHVMFVLNTEEVIESDEYGEAVCDAEVSWADQQSMMDVHAH